MDDSKIIDLFFERSEQAITELSEKYSKICHKISFNILGNEADAQECVNDAFLGIWNRIPPEKPEPLSAYVYRVVRNLALKKHRYNSAAKRNSFYDTALDEIESCLPSNFNAEDDADAAILSEEINLFLATLKKENRIIFVKRYWFGEDISAIAKSINTTSHNITVKLSRTRNALKKHLIEKGFDI
ncbi:MAG: sigma-70 family RNA polymerase sigma factor [Clostridia bacterium]|nr:sigma-70 family RNA polymerase sigma factor [Clostridia bacterium]